LSAEQNEKRSFFIFYAETTPDLAEPRKATLVQVERNAKFICIYQTKVMW